MLLSDAIFDDVINHNQVARSSVQSDVGFVSDSALKSHKCPLPRCGKMFKNASSMR
jgi:hypothetical protein